MSNRRLNKRNRLRGFSFYGRLRRVADEIKNYPEAQKWRELLEKGAVKQVLFRFLSQMDCLKIGAVV